MASCIYAMEVYSLETVQGRLCEEGYTALYNLHTNGVQMDIPSVSYFVDICTCLTVDKYEKSSSPWAKK